MDDDKAKRTFYMVLKLNDWSAFGVHEEDGSYGFLPVYRTWGEALAYCKDERLIRELEKEA